MDLIGELNRIKNQSAAETFDQTTDSLEAIRNFIAGAIGDAQGGFYLGVVTAVPGANQFTIDGLAGYGETCFTGWDAYVFWDAGGAGAAPQHETKNVTVYTNLGVFTTAAYTAPVAIGDIIILINPNFADVINDLNVPAADSVTNLLERDVIGNKTDAAVTTVGVVASTIAYVKGLLNQVFAVKAQTDLILPGVKLATKTSTSTLTTGTLFNWTGSIQILSIIGRVTTAIQAQSTTVKLGIQADALTIQDICATLDINGFLAGTMLGVTGSYADAMIGTTGVPTKPPTTPINATCITSGIIKVTYGAGSTGVIVWELLWVPLNATGSVTAA